MQSATASGAQMSLLSIVGNALIAPIGGKRMVQLRYRGTGRLVWAEFPTEPRRNYDYQCSCAVVYRIPRWVAETQHPEAYERYLEKAEREGKFPGDPVACPCDVEVIE